MELFKRICAVLPKGSPAPNVTIISSFLSSICIFCMFIFATIPRIPLSFTNILVPFPIIVNGTFSFFTTFKIYFSSSSSFIFIKISALPPTLKDVCFFIGSFKYIFSSGIFFINILNKLSIIKFLSKQILSFL